MGRSVGDDVVRSLAATGLPLVLLARDPVPGVDTIRARNARTAQTLAEHLRAHGHRRGVFLGDPASAPDVAGRYAGLNRVLPSPAVACGFDLESGRAAAADVLRDPPDVVVCANDEVALGVLLAAEAAGLSIPADVAVTGWDDLLAARFAHLTTVRQPMRELGATAARWLHGRIAERIDHPSGHRMAVRRRTLPTRLVVRRSCGSHPPEVQPS